MTRTGCLLVMGSVLVFCPKTSLAEGQGSPESVFRFDATLRVDLHHVGDQRSERFMIDELRQEGQWPSSQEQLIDPFGYGGTMVEVYATAPRGKLIFRYGYCSLFGEWRTSDEARARQRVFSETVRLPWPNQKVRLVMKSRSQRGQLVKIFETVIDPQSREVLRDRRQGNLITFKVHRSGPPERSLDIVILGDGYQRWQMTKYHQDVERFAQVLLSTAPFSAFRERINIWGVESPSRESGVDEPRKGIFRDTALSMGFNTFDSPRYLMSQDNQTVRDVAANVPYDAIYIMSNTSRYGGGGIYNYYASFVSDNEYDDYVFIHEFGHSFSGLGDEYYTSSVVYNDLYPRDVEPWEPNITTQTKRKKIKWRALIDQDTPLPTVISDAKHRDKVGLFEGAGYSAKGLYRPAVDCKMFNKGHKPFCPVCLKAMAEMIQHYLK